MTATSREHGPTALAVALTDEGHLSSPAWAEAFAGIPRHHFVPRFVLREGDGYRTLSGDDPRDRDEWLSAVYSDDSLVTQDRPHAAGHLLPSGVPLRVPTSSSTMPSLMARMLEALDIEDGMHVLEIGTGTGYNAALLSHRLGAANVVSIDIDPGLVDVAAHRLALLGLAPTLVAGDGVHGAPAHGPYDRIISTAAVPAIPYAWIQQLAPGGKILANLRGDLAGGTVCLLTKPDADDEVIGPVLALGGHFMWLRPDLDDPHLPHEHGPPPSRPRTTGRTTTALDPRRIAPTDGSFRFLLQLALRGVTDLRTATVHDPTAREQRDAVVVTASDGSRAECFVDPGLDGRWRVVQVGQRRLWDAIESTQRLWAALDAPAPDRFGVVANESTQFVWLDDDDGWYRWALPLV